MLFFNKSNRFFLILFFSLLLVSCSSKKSDDFIYLGENLLWCECENDEKVSEIKEKNFKKFDVHLNKNLSKVASNGSYVWLKTSFELSPFLKNKNVGLVIPYLHFCEEAYLNGEFLGRYGSFEPEMRSAMFVSHYYFLPEKNLNQNGENVIYIKAFVMGKSSISEHIFAGDAQKTLRISNNITFLKSKIYMLFEGGMFCAHILYLLMFLYRKRKTYLSFSLVNFFSLIFCTSFFAAEVPWFTSLNIPYLVFMKIVCYCCLPFLIFVNSCFMGFYVDFKQPKWFFGLRIAILLSAVVPVAFAKNIETIIKLEPFVISMYLLLFFFGFAGPVEAAVKHKNLKKVNHIVWGLFPIFFGVAIDIVTKAFMQLDLCPYFSPLFFQVTIVFYVFLLTKEFNLLTKRTEYLNEKLSLEVKEQTKELSDAKDNIEKEMIRSKIDLEMASVVQKGFFQDTQKRFANFDMAIQFEPMSTVSGDFYDYFYKKDKLNGIALFDVSGHGIAASLITILGKNIVSRCFENGLNKNLSVSQMLENINTMVCNEKAQVANYLTGLLFKVEEPEYAQNAQDENGENNENSVTKISFASAGHPSPLLYQAKIGKVIELKHEKDQIQYGAIGLMDSNACFAEVSFDFEEGDILLCYTDGLTEAHDCEGHQFGLESVIKILEENSDFEAKYILKQIVQAQKNFLKDLPVQDDTTFIVLKKEGELLEEL